MTRSTPSFRRLLVIATVPAVLLVASCGSSAPEDEPGAPAVDGGENPDNADTVVPPDQNGVGGGEPVDNLDPSSAEDDTDGDGAPG